MFVKIVKYQHIPFKPLPDSLLKNTYFQKKKGSIVQPSYKRPHIGQIYHGNSRNSSENHSFL